MMTEQAYGYDREVHVLIGHGWVLRCGHCRRRLDTEFAEQTHRVFADLSGRCVNDQDERIITPYQYVSTHFLADPFESEPVL